MINRVIPPPFFEDWSATMRDATRIDTSESSLKDLLLDRVLQNAKIFQLTITREGGNEIRVPETVDWPPFDRFISWPRNVKQPAPGGSFAKIYRHDRGNGAKLLYRVVNCAQRRNLAISDRIDKPSLCTWYWFENEPLYLEIENFGNLLTKTVKRRQSWYVNVHAVSFLSYVHIWYVWHVFSKISNRFVKNILKWRREGTLKCLLLLLNNISKRLTIIEHVKFIKLPILSTRRRQKEFEAYSFKTH